MAEDRLIAGIRCLQVLEKLDSYVADELTAPERTQIDAHLRECDWCTRFGGQYARVVEVLRTELDTAAAPSTRARKLAERLLSATDHGTPGV